MPDASLDLFGVADIDSAVGMAEDALRCIDSGRPMDARRSLTSLVSLLRRLRGVRDATPPAIHAVPTVSEVRAQAKAAVHLPERERHLMNALVASGEHGCIHKELDDLFQWPAVTASRLLTRLHYAQQRVVVRTARLRDDCHVYVHGMFWREEMGVVPPHTGGVDDDGT